MRILGIDLGSFSIKAVEIDSAFGRYDIHEYHEQALTTETSVADALQQFLQGLSKKPDRIIVSISSSLTTFRNLQIPSRDRKTIQSGVVFELEDELPFSVEDAVFDYALVSQSKQSSQVHVAASLKRHLEGAIANWNILGIQPDLITTEAWAYRTFLNRIQGTPHIADSVSDSVLLIQIGHEKTVLYLQWKNSPSLIRELAWGGKALTEAIAAKFNISFAEAEAIKIDRGFLAASPTPKGIDSNLTEQLDLTDCLEEALNSLIIEIKQLQMATKSSHLKSIKTTVISGGSSLLPGIGQWIEDRIGVPVRPILALSASTTSGVTYSEQADARFLLAVSLAFCLVGSDRALCINFRKGTFSKQSQGKHIDFQAIKKPLFAVGIVASCLFISMLVQSTVYQAQLKKTDQLLEKSIRTFFGQVSTSALKTYMSNTSALRASINKELNKQRELNKLFSPNPKSPLNFLNSLSQTIPRDVVVDMIEFQAGSPVDEAYGNSEGNQNTALTFLISNPQITEKLSSILTTKIKDVQRGKMEEVSAPDGTGKKWKVTFTGKQIEDSNAR